MTPPCAATCETPVELKEGSVDACIEGFGAAWLTETAMASVADFCTVDVAATGAAVARTKAAVFRPLICSPSYSERELSLLPASQISSPRSAVHRFEATLPTCNPLWHRI